MQVEDQNSLWHFWTEEFESEAHLYRELIRVVNECGTPEPGGAISIPNEFALHFSGLRYNDPNDPPKSGTHQYFAREATAYIDRDERTGRVMIQPGAMFNLERALNAAECDKSVQSGKKKRISQGEINQRDRRDLLLWAFDKFSEQLREFLKESKASAIRRYGLYNINPSDWHRRMGWYPGVNERVYADVAPYVERLKDFGCMIHQGLHESELGVLLRDHVANPGEAIADVSEALLTIMNHATVYPHLLILGSGSELWEANQNEWIRAIATVRRFSSIVETMPAPDAPGALVPPAATIEAVKVADEDAAPPDTFWLPREDSIRRSDEAPIVVVGVDAEETEDDFPAEPAATIKAGPSRVKGMTVEEANKAVTAIYLESKKLDWSVRELSKMVGCSPTQIRNTNAWQTTMKIRRQGHHETKRLGEQSMQKHSLSQFESDRKNADWGTINDASIDEAMPVEQAASFAPKQPATLRTRSDL